MARLYLFAEGQTEQTFTDTVLKPHLANFGVYLYGAVLVATSRKVGRVYRGGGRKYLPMKNDIQRFLKQEKCGYWGQPRVVKVTADGNREVYDDLCAHMDRFKAFVQLDDTGTLREFDHRGADSTGATFKPALSGNEIPEPVRNAIAAFAPHREGVSGVTVAEYKLGTLTNVR